MVLAVDRRRALTLCSPRGELDAVDELRCRPTFHGRVQATPARRTADGSALSGA